MITVGIDPSLTGAAVVALRDGHEEFAVCLPNKPTESILDRVYYIHHAITTLIENITNKERTQWQTPGLIAIEGFSYASKGAKLFEIAYLGWRIREELQHIKEQDGIPWIEVAPTQLKKFATGDSQAPKEVILQQVYKRWGYETPNDNIADAYVLARIAEAYLDDSRKLPEFQREVISALKADKPTKKKKKVKE